MNTHKKWLAENVSEWKSDYKLLVRKPKHMDGFKFMYNSNIGEQLTFEEWLDLRVELELMTVEEAMNCNPTYTPKTKPATAGITCSHCALSYDSILKVCPHCHVSNVKTPVTDDEQPVLTTWAQWLCKKVDVWEGDSTFLVRSSTVELGYYFANESTVNMKLTKRDWLILKGEMKITPELVDYVVGDEWIYQGDVVVICEPVNTQRIGDGDVWVDNLEMGYKHWVAKSNLTSRILEPVIPETVEAWAKKHVEPDLPTITDNRQTISFISDNSELNLDDIFIMLVEKGFDVDVTAQGNSFKITAKGERQDESK